MKTTTISIDDLELVRDTLNVVRNYFQMLDIQRQAMTLAEQPRYSALTTQISSAAERVDGILKDHLLEEYEASEEEEAAEEELLSPEEEEEKARWEDEGGNAPTEPDE